MTLPELKDAVQKKFKTAIKRIAVIFVPKKWVLFKVGKIFCSFKILLNLNSASTGFLINWFLI